MMTQIYADSPFAIKEVHICIFIFVFVTIKLWIHIFFLIYILKHV